MSASLRHSAPMACLLAVALTATACGGGSGSAAAKKASPTTAATPTAVATTGAAGSPSTGAPSATTGPSTPASTGAATPSAGGVTPSVPVAVTGIPSEAPPTKVKATGGGKFCKDVAAAVNNAASAVTGSSAADEKKQVQDVLQEFTVLLVEAPSQIQGDLTKLAAPITTFYAALVKANYDITKVDPATEKALEANNNSQAETNVDNYVKAHCGIDLSNG